MKVAASSSPPVFQASVTMIVKAVKLTTTRVSMKVCVIDTSACRTGWVVLAAAAAMPPVPSPDSLEKIPRATP